MTPAARPSVPALQAAADEATDAEWFVIFDLPHYGHVIIEDLTSDTGFNYVARDCAPEDARFIAMADPQAVAALCAIAQAANDVSRYDDEMYGTEPPEEPTPHDVAVLLDEAMRALRAALGAVSFTGTTTDNGAADGAES